MARTRVQGVVMAGGQGTRLRPLTLTEPKPFLPVAGRPVMEWGLRSLARAGITDVVVTTAYKRGLLQDRLGDGAALGLSLRYAEEAEPLGTAGGVKNAEHLIEGRFVVMSADVVSDVALERLVARHEKTGAAATMGLVRVDDPSPFGVAVLDDAGAITRFQEKPKREQAFSDLVNAGIYVLEPEVLERVPEGTPFDFSKDLFPTMLGDGLYGHPIEGYWKDVGRPGDLITANTDMARRIGKWRFGACTIDPGATVEDTVVMEGARVARGATVRRSLLLPGAVVDADAVVSASVVGRGGHVGARARLAGCVLGSRATAAAGEILEDVRRPDG